MARTSKDSAAKAKAYALKLLNYRSRSCREMRERLERKGFAGQEIEAVMDALARVGLLDDRACAGELALYAWEKKHLGRKGVSAFLSRRGFDRKLITQVLSTHTESLEEYHAREFVKKKIRSMKDYPADVLRRRLWGMLARRGFQSDVASRVIKDLITSNEDLT